jgi:hypothetical protein
VAIVSGDTVIINGNGTTIITATQPGDTAYNPATPVQQSLTVLQKSLSISGLTVETKLTMVRH